MIRTQIQLTKEQIKKLRELSLMNHESIASLIRGAVDQFLLSGKRAPSSLYRQAATVLGKYTAAKDDIAVAHDRYLEEDFGS